MHLSPSLQAQTKKLLRIMEENQSGIIRRDEPCAAVEEDPNFDVNSLQFQLLEKCHTLWRSSQFVKCYQILQADFISGAR